MAKARLYFDGDNSGIEKEARIYSLTQEVEDKLDSISNFQSEIDDLQDQINNLASRGRYLSTWNAVTGLPETNPQVDPYVYRAGDYYIVSVVGGTNYRPQGSEYHIGVASQALETQLVEVNDLYIYDGVQWIKQGSGSSVNVTWGSIAGALSNQTDLQNALDNKANKTDVLEKTNTTSYTPTADYNPATKKYVDDEIANIDLSTKQDKLTAGANIQISAQDVISATDTTYTAGENIQISNTNEISAPGLQKELTAGNNVTIEDICTTESDMKGPCPSGFHIGTRAEWTTLKNTWVGLGQDGAAGDVFAAKFKIPFGNYRWAGTNANTSNQGTNGMYWTSTPSSGYSAYFIVMRSGYFSPDFEYARTYGFSVRPFKNTPVAPDNTWTTILDGSSVATGAGIFYNATEGLISASSNGTTWTTIADKNVGATVAWNEGDALSADNCGGLFQWGNNYMFPFSGTVSGTTTLVDTTGYGPGNYYYSDLFNTTYQDWASPHNNNLWGGVSQSTHQECIHNVISATDTIYIAGTGIAIDSNNEISVDTSVVATQTDLQNGLDEKQDLLTAGDNITIEDVCTTESDMQGPAPDGFHVPLNTEWQAVYDIWTALGGGSSDGANFGIALKLPFAGNRSRSNAGVYSQGTIGYYWSSSRNDTNNAYYLNFNSAALGPLRTYLRANGQSVRCFKNSPTVPTSSWTKLYGTSIEAGGIFWSSTDGLISLSSDGQTWVTIADKNLGATTVWNSGDTLSEANCGKYYQWGNNYGFPFTGTIANQSTTQVDASNYGPGNYYSSSTFIIYTGRWDSTDNGNLWGGITQGTWQDCTHNVISATDTIYIAGTGIAIDSNNEISNTLPGAIVSATAPSSPTEGMVWYDTTNDALKTYDGTNWNIVGREYNAGLGITIGTIVDYSAMRGPCASGYHVPTSTEWANVKTVWTTLGGGATDGANFGITLKMPFAGMRYCEDGGLSMQGTVGYYYSCSCKIALSTLSIMAIKASTLNEDSLLGAANAATVRPFKDEPVVPTSSWTKLYGTSIEAGGIFWSSADGLISLSSDGTTWITIADKNLGATTVWNSGDTLSEANCGKYYQWGNNYAFPWSGILSDTSTTQVDATGYGPGNYYYDDTFITVYGNWDSSNNRNLWGGETGAIITNDAISNTGVLSVNGQTGAVTISGGDVVVSDQPNNILTSGMKIRAGLETDYQNLGTYDSQTLYLTVE